MSWLTEDFVRLGDIDQAAAIATSMAALTSRADLGISDLPLNEL
jgi:hypothetical protein